VKYPKTEKKPVIESYFETEITDNYRWLEDDRSPDTKAWVEKQNKVTFNHLNTIPFRAQLQKRLTSLWNYEKISAPKMEGDFTYFYKNDGLQNQHVLYRKNKSGKEEIFLDPNTFSKDGTTSLDAVRFSKDGSLVAYSISEGGSDWRKIIVIDTLSKKIIDEPLVDIKFSGISWKGNEGFYYSSYDKPKGSELSAKTNAHKLYYHRLNTPQKNDEIIFGETQERRYVGGYLTEDNQYLVVTAAIATSGNELYLQDLSKPNSTLVPMVGNFDSDSAVISNRDTTLYIVTNLKAPNKKIVVVNAENPQSENWKDLIPETENVLSTSTAGNFIFTHYMKDAVSKIMCYSYDGKLIRNITLPGIGSVGGFNGKTTATDVYFTFTNYYTPATTYQYNLNKGTYNLYWEPKIDFNSNDYESKQVFFTSKDGTKIPMLLTYKKGLKRTAKNPTVLYGYGGFNISLTPAFSIGNVVWLEQGGIYAVANLRGGGEYGKQWHDAGTQLKKQNVFDDFIAAAEFLIQNKYTCSNFLALRGGSNGGLLVGAVMTQKPNLAKVVLPAVGVLDMLRYHTFTAGAGWAYDYGTAEDSKEMFAYLKKYSPVHNVQKGSHYPATLITTGDHDDRVVPAHSFKFAAELQDKQSGNLPVLIRIETNAGHGAGTPVAKIIAQFADVFGFAFYHMGFEKLPFDGE